MKRKSIANLASSFSVLYILMPLIPNNHCLNGKENVDLLLRLRYLGIGKHPTHFNE